MTENQEKSKVTGKAIKEAASHLAKSIVEVKKEVKDVTPPQRKHRIKPLCDTSPDFGATSNVRPPKNRQYVKGIFKNLECPGTMQSFPFRKYKEPIKFYHLMDGQTYKLPVEVVEHLNNDCAYKQHKWALGRGNKSIAMDGSDVSSNKEVDRMTSRVAW